MKIRPILFNGEMVRAILDGRKIQTRRVVKKSEGSIDGPFEPAMAPGIWNNKGLIGLKQSDGRITLFRCPFGQPGDRLWVRETHAYVCGEVRDRKSFSAEQHGIYFEDAESDDFTVRYAATDPMCWEPQRWRPSIHMPRWASRITLQITGVRVERLQDISEEDAKAEGILAATKDGNLWKYSESSDRRWMDWTKDPREAFLNLWTSVYGEGELRWGENPWVWVIEFRMIN